MLIFQVCNNNLQVLDPSDMYFNMIFHLICSLDYVLDIFHIDLEIF